MCFSLVWLEQFLVWLIVICAVVALLRLLVGDFRDPPGSDWAARCLALL